MAGATHQQVVAGPAGELVIPRPAEEAARGGGRHGRGIYEVATRPGVDPNAPEVGSAKISNGDAV